MIEKANGVAMEIIEWLEVVMAALSTQDKAIRSIDRLFSLSPRGVDGVLILPVLD